MGTESKPVSELNAILRQGILCALAGFPILIVFAGVWTLAGVLSYLLPREIAPWAYVFLGAPGMPIAIMLEKRLGYVPAPNPGPYLLAIVFSEDALHYTGFFVGAVLLAGALSVRAHARNVWIQSQQTTNRAGVHR